MPDIVSDAAKIDRPKAVQILQGAMPEFLAHGYARTSMDRVAKAAGVSKQTLYSYFADKEGLFTALVQQIAREKFRLVWSQPLSGEPEVVLRRIAQHLLHDKVFDADYLNFCRLIVAESGKRPDLAKIFLSNISKPAIETLARYFRAHPELEFEDSKAAATIFCGSLIYFVFNQEILHGKEAMPLSAEAIVDNLIALVLANTHSRSRKGSCDRA
ncbi:MAG: TetR/AcrR family transcriptional regulator [Cyanobacteria bacterium J06641_5]